MATYPIRQLADNGGTAQFVPVTAPEAVQFPDGSNLNTLIGSIATIESNPVAANHAVGEFLCINGQVYEVIDAIAAGDSISLGENVQVTNLGSQITELNNGLMKYPDYSSSGILYNFSASAVTLNYTAPEDCYMNIHVINASASSLSVNGVAVASSARAGDYYQLSYAGYLKAGDVVKSSGVVRGIILKLR